MLSAVRSLPFFRIFAIARLALVARRHLQHLTPDERRRLAALVRKRRGLSAGEKEELRDLVGKLDARAFAGSAVERISPLPLPRRFTRARY
jgi:hypothetical protein